MFYCLRAPKRPFDSRKGNAVEKGLTGGGRRNTLLRDMEGEGGWDGKGRRVGFWLLSLWCACSDRKPSSETRQRRVEPKDQPWEGEGAAPALLRSALNLQFVRCCSEPGVLGSRTADGEGIWGVDKWSGRGCVCSSYATIQTCIDLAKDAV